jgi:hypothetical protein
MEMDSNKAKNEMKVTVLIELAAICRKVAENSHLPNNLRLQARQLVEEFDLLLPARGKGSPSKHAQGQVLIIKMARFLPKICEIQSWPEDSAKL